MFANNAIRVSIGIALAKRMRAVSAATEKEFLLQKTFKLNLSKNLSERMTLSLGSFRCKDNPHHTESIRRYRLMYSLDPNNLYNIVLLSQYNLLDTQLRRINH